MPGADNISSHGRSGSPSAPSVASLGRISPGGVSITIPEPEVIVIVGGGVELRKPLPQIKFPERERVIPRYLLDDDEIFFQ